MAGVLVGPENIDLSFDTVHEFILLNTLRSQLRELLIRCDLPTSLTNHDQLWNQFVTYYAGVIEHGTLSCSAPGPTLKHVSQVTFTKGRGRMGELLPFNMAWRVALLDGRTMDVDVSARLGTRGQPLASWGLHLN